MGIAIGVGLLIAGCGSAGSGDDPYRNAVSDKRAPEVSVTVRDGAGEPVADIAYDASNGRVPDRGIYAFLQMLDGDTWSTAYTLSDNVDDGFVEGVPEDFDDPAFSGPGPDTYRLPDLDTDNTYRICISFVIRGQSANGCSAPFHTG